MIKLKLYLGGNILLTEPMPRQKGLDMVNALMAQRAFASGEYHVYVIEID